MRLHENGSKREYLRPLWTALLFQPQLLPRRNTVDMKDQAGAVLSVAACYWDARCCMPSSLVSHGLTGE